MAEKVRCLTRRLQKIWISICGCHEMDWVKLVRLEPIGPARRGAITAIIWGICWSGLNDNPWLRSHSWWSRPWLVSGCVLLVFGYLATAMLQGIIEPIRGGSGLWGKF